MLKWILVGALFLLLVGAASVGVYFLIQPEEVTAKAVFLVDSTPSSWDLYADSAPPQPTERQIRSHRETMAALLVSQAVLTAALQNPDLQGTFLTDAEKPNEWLEENLVAEFDGDSDLLEIRLEGPADYAEDLKAILKAVSGAFLDEIVTKARLDKVKYLDSLRTSFGEYTDALQRKLTELETVRKELGGAAVGNPEVRIRELEIESLERTQTKLADKVQWLEFDVQRDSPIRLVDPAYISEE